MAKHEWQIGEIKFSVEAPDGMRVAGGRVDIEPANADEFMEAAEAVGGLQNLSMPDRVATYAQSAYASAGEDDFRVTVAIQEPPRPRPAQSRMHPFFGPLRQQAERAEASA